MRVLVACEFSGIVRAAFRARGHYSVSCDLLSSELPGLHYRGDVRKLLSLEWDLVLAFPPCTHLCVSGARWFRDKVVEQMEAVKFFMLFVDCAERVCIENPIGVMSRYYRKPDQIVQPWQFGHGEVKATCLWLRGLPLLVPSRIVDGREARVHREPPGPERWKRRSRTFQGLAEAMADQWNF